MFKLSISHIARSGVCFCFFPLFAFGMQCGDSVKALADFGSHDPAFQIKLDRKAIGDGYRFRVDLKHNFQTLISVQFQGRGESPKKQIGFTPTGNALSKLSQSFFRNSVKVWQLNSASAQNDTAAREILSLPLRRGEVVLEQWWHPLGDVLVVFTRAYLKLPSFYKSWVPNWKRYPGYSCYLVNRKQATVLTYRIGSPNSNASIAVAMHDAPRAGEVHGDINPLSSFDIQMNSRETYPNRPPVELYRWSENLSSERRIIKSFEDPDEKLVNEPHP
jgi:hypothetical protein